MAVYSLRSSSVPCQLRRSKSNRLPPLESPTADLPARSKTARDLSAPGDGGSIRKSMKNVSFPGTPDAPYLEAKDIKDSVSIASQKCLPPKSPAGATRRRRKVMPAFLTASTVDCTSELPRRRPHGLELSSQSTLSPMVKSMPSPLTPGGVSRSCSSEWSLGEGTEQTIQETAVGRWKKGAKIGCGSYGSVYKALDLDTGRVFAVKRTVVEECEDDPAYTEKIEHELNICQDLRHPNIVTYLGHQYLDNHLYIYLDYVSGGSMSSIYGEFGPIQGALLRKAASGMVEGLNYLHTRKPPVVHRDIKCANILVDLNFCVKLADFGCSRRADCTKSFTTIGSIPWMAPEVIQQKDGHGRKADVWSLGCTIIEMVSAEKPWGKAVFDNIMYAMRHIGMSDALPPVPADASSAAREFIAACVQRQSDERPSTVQLLDYALVSDDAK